MIQPPKWMQKLLVSICDKDLLEAVDGDLFELFQQQLEQYGSRQASILYLFNVIQFMQPFSFNSPQYYRSVYLSYIRVIFRSMKRKKVITTMNVFSMSLAFLISMAIFSYVSHEMSYDKYHQNQDRIYRVTYRFQNSSGYDIHWARMNQNWVNELPNTFPEVEKLIRFQSFRARDVGVGNQNFKENHAYAVDKDVFDVFDFEIVTGSKSQSLMPYTVVLTTSSAQKYFGNNSPVGLSMDISNDEGVSETYVVTAVIKDPPSNTHLPINLLTSINHQDDRVGWAYTYILLEEHTSIQSIQTKIQHFISDHQSLDEGDKLTIDFQPLSSIHLYSHLSREIEPNGDVKKSVIFVFVGLFLMIIGAVNFINLNTVQSLGRIKEFGLRQSMGARKGALKAYMILEALILGLMSVILALIGFVLGLGPFERFVGHVLVFNYLEMLGYLFVLLIIIASLSTLVSSVPFFQLDFNQIINWFSFSKGYKSIQKRILLGVQFSAVLLLITCMVIVQRQFAFMTSKDLGYNGERLLVLRNNSREVMRKYESLKYEIKKLPGVVDVTALMEMPSVPVKDQGLVTLLGDPQTNISADIQVMDFNATEVLEMKLMSGELLPQYLRQNMDLTDSALWEDFATKGRAYLINESACKSLGWTPEEAVSQQIDWTIGNLNLKHGPIFGVIQDFHQESLNEKIRPLIVTYEPLWLRNVFVKIDTDDVFVVHESIEDLWESNFPNEPLELSYLDQELESQYHDEKKQLQLISVFTLVAILIAFIGLYAMMSYAIKLRLKELAIRRVLGSNWFDTAKLLSMEYMILAIFSMCLIFPLAYWLMDSWLVNYAYHIAINGTGFVLSGGLLLVLILLTLTYQIIRNRNTNPTLVLKSE